MNVLTRPEFSDLKLPNGAPATQLRLGPLFAELSRLHVRGIDPHMGKPELLACYSSYLTQRKQAAIYNSGDELLRSVIASQATKAG